MKTKCDQHVFLASALLMVCLVAPAVCQTAPQDIGLLKKINREVNREITYLSDLEHYGVEDKHVAEPGITRPAGLPKGKYGDCEDFALTKSRRLSLLGVPNVAMHVVIVEVPNRPVLHSVLLVDAPANKIAEEHYVLDSYDNIIYKKSQLEKKDWLFGGGVRGAEKRETDGSKDEMLQKAMRDFARGFDKNGDGRVSIQEMSAKNR